MMVSCTKQKDTPFVEQETFIKIGDMNGMSIDSVQKVIEGAYWNPQTIELDLDKDSLPDILLKVMIWGSPGMGMHPFSEIQCLNPNFELYGNVTIDTLFYHRHISYFEANNLINKVTESHYNCKKTETEDAIYSTKEEFHIKPLYANDVLDKTDGFRSDTISFIYASQSNQMYFYDGGDTAYISSSKTLIDCHSIAYNEDFYIGLRSNIANEIKLGWIFMRIDAANRISYFNSAIQK